MQAAKQAQGGQPQPPQAAPQQQPAQQAQPQPQPAQQAPVANVANFSLTPGTVNLNQPIDYSQRSGQKIWDEATAPLTNPFEVDSRGAATFCENLLDRAKKSGWWNILTIPDQDGKDRDLITNYGMLRVEDIRGHVQGYMDQPTRQAQHSVQMYHAIMNSLTSEGRERILNEQDKYNITDANGVTYQVGPLLFKIVMSKAIVDTKATIYHYRSNLMHLDTYMPTVESNITKFNEYVKANRQGLLARGQSIDDLLYYLFEGYMTASDKGFVKYIKDKRDAYNDGTEDFTPDLLMKFAENKYEGMVREGSWNQMSIEQQEIVALSAKLTKINDDNLKLTKKLTQIAEGKKNSNNSNKKSSNQSKGKKGKQKSNKAKQEEQAKWKREKPTSQDKKTTVNGHSYYTRNHEGKTYYWCEYHDAWVLHLPEDDGDKGCRLRKKLNKEEKGNKTVSFSAALTSIMNDIESDSE